MTDKPPPPKVKVPMGQRKSGLAVPKDAVDTCQHIEVMKRIKPKFEQFVCKGCTEKVVLVIFQAGLMTMPQFEAFQMDQARAMLEAKRQQTTGLVTPDQVRREQQEKKR